MNLRPWVLLAALVAASSCKKETPAAAPTPAPAPVAAAKPAKAPEAVPASVSGKSDPDCLGPIDLAPVEKLTIAGKKAEQTGYKLSFLDKDQGEQVTFGVLGSINEDSGENLVNLKKYLDFFKAEGARAILVVGDSGDSRESIERALAPVAETGLPTFVLTGNRECRADFNDALASLQKSHPNVVNLGKVRDVEFDGVELISLPGYYDKKYIHCANGTGCQYFKQDVEALKTLAKQAENPVVLVSHGPPHGEDANAIDRLSEGTNVGDANLTALIAETGIPFGVFPNIKEAGGRATNLDGSSLIREGELADKLFLNPGAADSVAWSMNDGTQSVGMAATLTVKGQKASYKIFRAKALSAEEKAQAQKLAPKQAAAKEEAAPAKDEKKEEKKAEN